ncbi:GMC family oxidoreductase N-terminal domain-containing protein [Streptomyces sp. NPDC097610]|uniref:GMC family oxidoreductase N-terminal domain-containing protein n=1 Tax=Streptomyces sp. NPDC097610 TaxID=3157227 RepID=UPI00332E413C
MFAADGEVSVGADFRAPATKITLEGSRAAGVTYLQDGQERVAHADREIPLCGGSINSPQLLLLSGIGDPGEPHYAGIAQLRRGRRVPQRHGRQHASGRPAGGRGHGAHSQRRGSTRPAGVHDELLPPEPADSRHRPSRVS